MNFLGNPEKWNKNILIYILTKLKYVYGTQESSLLLSLLKRYIDSENEDKNIGLLIDIYKKCTLNSYKAPLLIDEYIEKI